MQDFDFIETPENVELKRRLAGIGTRFIAGLVDHLLIFLILLVLFVVGMVASVGSMFYWHESTALIITVLIVMAFVIYWGYFAFFEWRSNGQSPGKKNQKIRVVKDGGGPIVFTDIAIRNLLRVVDLLGAYAVAGACMFFTRKCQRLGDLTAGTVVVCETVADYSPRADRKIPVAVSIAATAGALRDTGLTAQEYQALSSYWQRRQVLGLDARAKICRELVLPILLRRGLSRNGTTFEAIELDLDIIMHSADSPAMPLKDRT